MNRPTSPKLVRRRRRHALGTPRRSREPPPPRALPRPARPRPAPFHPVPPRCAPKKRKSTSVPSVTIRKITGRPEVTLNSRRLGASRRVAVRRLASACVASPAGFELIKWPHYRNGAIRANAKKATRDATRRRRSREDARGRARPGRAQAVRGRGGAGRGQGSPARPTRTHSAARDTARCAIDGDAPIKFQKIDCGTFFRASPTLVPPREVGVASAPSAPPVLYGPSVDDVDAEGRDFARLEAAAGLTPIQFFLHRPLGFSMHSSPFIFGRTGDEKFTVPVAAWPRGRVAGVSSRLAGPRRDAHRAQLDGTLASSRSALSALSASR